MHKKHKDRDQRRHFCRRMAEREGIAVGPEVYEEIMRQIRIGEAKHLEDQSLRVKIKGVRIAGQWLVVVYDRMRKTLVTVLPRTSVFYAELEGK
jgi:hypothetical protein